MEINLTSLEIKILLKCSASLLHRSYTSQLYRKYGIKERNNAINNLITSGLIIALEKPKPGANKTPVYYKITELGIHWVNQYLKNYPK